jgi:carbamoyltransferase
MYILGLSCFYHDSAAALLKDGEIIAAAQEERFTRIKHDPSFPVNAVRYCLEEAGIDMDDVDYVSYYEKPHLKAERILTVFADYFPRSHKTFHEVASKWIGQKFGIPDVIRQSLQGLGRSGGRSARWLSNVVYCEHHLSHAASAFYPSPFEDAAILTIDGVGEWATTSLSMGTMQGGVPRIEFLKEMRFPDSLGMLYSAFTYHLGFKVNSGEYKVMGLAPYGAPVYYERIVNDLVRLKPDGSFKVNRAFFTYPYDHHMTNVRFGELFGFERRSPESSLEKHHFDLAASIQRFTETVVLSMCNHAHSVTNSDRICLAGGVALNCVANGKILGATPFKDVWVQPAAGDAGGALGAAYHVWHELLGQPKAFPSDGSRDLMKGSYLGPAFDTRSISEALEKNGLKYRVFEDDKFLFEELAELLANDKIVGLFNGRMEFGPRALGGRSIIGNPCAPEMQRTMNLKIKFRESFRPFAPAVMREHVGEWFEISGKPGSLLGGSEGYDSPYMLMVAPVKEERRYLMEGSFDNMVGLDKLNHVRSVISSCTHVDFSARIQTVAGDTNPFFHGVIEAFKRRTGCPVLINTSFNVRGEPIVCTPEDAVRCFLGTDMDVLVLDNILVLKSEQGRMDRVEYHQSFELD